MRIFKFNIRIVLMVAVLALFGAFINVKDSNAGAPNYMGEFCWEVAYDVSFNIAPFTVPFGVTQMGDTYYQFNGDGATGSAKVNGGSINLLLHMADTNGGFIWTDTLSATLNAGTLDGNWKILSHNSEQIELNIHEAYYGTMTSVPCP